MKRTLEAVKLFIALVTAFHSFIAPGSAQPPSTSKSQLQTTFKSAGRTIKVEWFRPNTADSPKSVVLILHGSGGLEPEGGFFRQIATDIAKTGRGAVVVHYFDRSGISWASSAQMGAHFGEWMATIKDAITFIEKQPGMTTSGVTLLGHSLGAQLALHVAASDRRVNGVIDMAGCFVLPTKSISRMPPVLILHGTADKVVPLTRERATVTVMRATKSRYEEHILKGVDHAFNNVSLDTLERLMTAFLDSLK